MKHRIVTISREFGSGGRTVGKEVAEKLSIPCYDHELIERLAEESGFAKEYVEAHSEDAAHAGRFSNALAGGYTFNSFSGQDYLWAAQQKVILQLAQEGPCVIVGRCADYILRDEADLLRVFIHADMEKRAERIVRLYGERSDAPEKRLRDKDKRRRAYYQFYTDMTWGDARNYHITLDSGALGIEKCTEIIAGAY